MCRLLPQWPGGVVYISGWILAVALYWRTSSTTPTTVAVYHGSFAWLARKTCPIGSLFGQHFSTKARLTTTPRWPTSAETSQRAGSVGERLPGEP